MHMNKFNCKTIITAFCLTFLPLISIGQNTYSDTIAHKLSLYKKVKLSTDLSGFTPQQKEGIKLLIHAAMSADQIFWEQSFGNKSYIDSISDSNIRQYGLINYGPWDRLDNNKPFIKGYPNKPLGANFYPHDMRQTEFDSFTDPQKKNQYSVIERDEKGMLKVVPYSTKYFAHINHMAQLLRIAGNMLGDSMLKNYLFLRAEDLLKNDYMASDRAWLDMKDNVIDIVIGPIENYEDQLYGIRTAFESYVLVKDISWSKKLEKYVSYLPSLQENLPVPNEYKAEKAGSSSQLNAYDIIYYAGDCNSGSKTIAVNLPNDETLQIEKGTRRSQLKNAMKAKFDYIMLPISNELIDPTQRKYVKFDAFFANTMFHEVAHGLGIKNTINGKGTVREALGADYSALEEGKADILGLYMVTELYNKKVLKEGELMDYYVTFMAGIFRSVRFGASSAHGKANMIRFNYFKEMGAFTRDAATGFYKIDLKKMQEAMKSLSALILKIQGDGDVVALKKLLEEKGKIFPELQADIDKLSNKNIPVDVVFEQGIEVLDLNK
jgi:hypothetical protein